jgi:predicted nucleotidyltransferase
MIYLVEALRQLDKLLQHQVDLSTQAKIMFPERRNILYQKDKMYPL